MNDIQNVKNFWETNPLFVGESNAKEGSKEFFQEHSLTYLNDCFSGEFDEKCFLHVALVNFTLVSLFSSVGRSCNDKCCCCFVTTW